MALSANRDVSYQKIDPATGGLICRYGVLTNTVIYKGAFVRIGTGGYIEPCGSTSVEPVLGVALDEVDNNPGASGALNCEVLVGGYIEHAVTSVTIANIGDKVYASDDETLVLTATTNEPCGVVVAVPAAGTAIVKMYSNAVTNP